MYSGGEEKGTMFSNRDLGTMFSNRDSLDTGCKLNVHKTFRRRHGGLLNVVCTFNLRPASTDSGLCI